MTLSSLSYVVFLDPLKASVKYAFSLLLEYVVFVGLRHCLLSRTLLLIGLCGAYKWER